MESTQWYIFYVAAAIATVVCSKIVTTNVDVAIFFKDHRDKIVPDPRVVEDLISDKLNNRRQLARLINQYRDIFSNISEGTAFLLQGVLCNTLKKEGRAFRNMNDT